MGYGSFIVLRDFRSLEFKSVHKTLTTTKRKDLPPSNITFNSVEDINHQSPI